MKRLKFQKYGIYKPPHRNGIVQYEFTKLQSPERLQADFAGRNSVQVNVEYDEIVVRLRGMSPDVRLVVIPTGERSLSIRLVKD